MGPLTGGSAPAPVTSAAPQALAVDLSGYSASLQPAAARRQLPAVLRTGLTAEQRDAIELSPLATSSPPARLGFEAKWNISFLGRTGSDEIDCGPLPSGLMRCARRFIPVTQTLPRVSQGVYAYGGLVALVIADFGAGSLAPTSVTPLQQIRVKTGSAQGLPMPGLDYVYFAPSQVVGDAHPRIRCVPSRVQPPAPAELAGKGVVTAIACSRDNTSDADTSRVLESAETMLGSRSLADLGLPDSTVYFWLAEQGIAIPAAMFGLRLPGESRNGLFGPWTGLRGHASSEYKITVEYFRWKK